MKLLRWIRSHKIISAILLLIVVGIVYQATKPAPPPEIVTEVVERTTLYKTVDASAEVRSALKTDLAFQTSGRVSALLVQEGNTVAPGQPLALLDTTSLFPGAATSPILSAISRLETPSLSSGLPAAITSAEGTTQSAETTFTNAQNDLELVERVREASIAEAQGNLEKAQADLEDLADEHTQDRLEIQEDFAGILQGNVIAIRTALADADTILGVTNTLANDDFEDILSLQNQQYLVDAENAYQVALSSLEDVETRTFVLTTTSSYSDIDAVRSDVETTLQQTAQVLLSTHQVLDATTVDVSGFSFTDLATKKTLMDTDRDLIRAEQDALEAQQQLRLRTDIDQASELRSQELTVLQLERTLATTQASQDKTLSTAQATLATALASLEQQIASSLQTIGSTQAQLRDAEISTPIAGVVTNIDIEIGEYATAGTTVVTVQAIDATTFELVADIAEADISRIAPGQPVDVEFDAYGSKQTFPAQVASVDLAEKTVEGVVFYEATLFFTAPETLPVVKPGMTADVVILVEELQDILSVPQRAILSQDGELFVRLKEGEEIKQVPIVTGRRADGGRTEVLEGLEEATEIVITIRE